MSIKKLAQHKSFDHVSNWLEDSELNYVKLIDRESSLPIKYKDESTGGVKEIWDSKAVSTKHKSVKALFETLFQKDYRDIVVYFRKSNGSSSTPYGQPIGLHLEEEKAMLRVGGENGGAASSVAPFQTFNNENNMGNNDFGMGFLGSAANSAGLGFAELVELKKIQALYLTLKETYDDLKRSSKDDSSKWSIEEVSLKSQIADMQRKLDTAADKLDLAIQKERLDTKPMISPEVMQTLAGAVPEITSMLFNKGGGMQQAHQALAGGVNLSESKQQLIEFIASDETTEEVSNFMASLIFKLSNEAGFRESLQQFMDAQ